MKLYKSNFTDFYSSFLAVSFMLLPSFFLTGCSQQPDQKPVSIIFDTDFGSDYEDVGAITILHALEEKGEADILATVADNKYEGIAAVLDVFNTYWGEPDMPIGVPKGKAINKADWQHWTDTILANYPHDIKFNNEVPGAVDVYRKVLSSQPDSSVTIVAIGFLTNLANLLHSGPDKYSSLNGKELVEKKVKKLVSMAGAFPQGKEYNLRKDLHASKEVFYNWPTPVIFSGWEVGAKIKTGLPLIQNENIKNNPTKDVYRMCLPIRPEDSLGRMSWDETTVLVAVRGYKPFFGLQEGRIKINSDSNSPSIIVPTKWERMKVNPYGSNSWDEDGKGQYYLVLRSSPKEIEKVINQLQMQQPVNK